MPNATKSYVNKSIERLYGIIEGISIDGQINDQEIISLKKWADTHEIMNEIEPFKGLNLILTEILEDRIIDKDERESLLEWCADTLNEKGFIEDLTKAIRRLHGIFSGISCDSKIMVDELEGMQDWLLDYEQFQGWWPFNELNKLIKEILEDGEIDNDEHRKLQIFFNDFVEHVIEDPIIHDEEYWLNNHMMSPSPIFNSISSICAMNPKIEFKDRIFCFTGPAASGTRGELSLIVNQLGGSTINAVHKFLDYLIIGAQSSPAWVYSTYGRKIEAALNTIKNDETCKTIIINEYDFIKAAKQSGKFLGHNINRNPGTYYQLQQKNRTSNGED